MIICLLEIVWENSRCQVSMTGVWPVQWCYWGVGLVGTPLGMLPPTLRCCPLHPPPPPKAFWGSRMCVASLPLRRSSEGFWRLKIDTFCIVGSPAGAESVEEVREGREGWNGTGKGQTGWRGDRDGHMKSRKETGVIAVAAAKSKSPSQSWSHGIGPW